MGRISKQSKLAVLRAKTDRDLLILIRRELDRGLAVADVAANKDSLFHAEAEKAYRKVVTLLLKAPDMRRGERTRIEAKLKELRLLLEQVPAVAKVERHPASFASGG